MIPFQSLFFNPNSFHPSSVTSFVKCIEDTLEKMQDISQSKVLIVRGIESFENRCLIFPPLFFNLILAEDMTKHVLLHSTALQKTGTYTTYVVCTLEHFFERPVDSVEFLCNASSFLTPIQHEL